MFAKKTYCAGSVGTLPPLGTMLTEYSSGHGAPQSTFSNTASTDPSGEVHASNLLAVRWKQFPVECAADDPRNENCSTYADKEGEKNRQHVATTHGTILSRGKSKLARPTVKDVSKRTGAAPTNRRRRTCLLSATPTKSIGGGNALFKIVVSVSDLLLLVRLVPIWSTPVPVSIWIVG